MWVYRTLNRLWQEKYGRGYTEEDIDALYAQFEEKLMSILDQFADPKPHVLDTVAALRDARPENRLNHRLHR